MRQARGRAVVAVVTAMLVALSGRLVVLVRRLLRPSRDRCG